MRRRYPYINYLRKAILWYFGNLLFGLFPVCLVLLVNKYTKGNIGKAELDAIIHSGVVNFVAVAVMGAVVVESLLARHAYRGLAIFAIYLFPVLILGILTIQYLLVYTNLTDNTCFNINSLTTISTLTLSLLYSAFAKANFYIMEDITYEPKF